jgi:hypothetical protein
MSGAAVVLPIRLMNSSESDASDWISSAPERTPVLDPFPALAGVNVTLMLHIAPGSSVVQVLVVLKSGGAIDPSQCRVAVPVFVSVTVCAAEALPTGVLAKLSALCERL